MCSCDGLPTSTRHLSRHLSADDCSVGCAATQSPSLSRRGARWHWRVPRPPSRRRTRSELSDFQLSDIARRAMPRIGLLAPADDAVLNTGLTVVRVGAHSVDHPQTPAIRRPQVAGGARHLPASPEPSSTRTPERCLSRTGTSTLTPPQRSQHTPSGKFAPLASAALKLCAVRCRFSSMAADRSRHTRLRTLSTISES